jgi:hypothetical protein
VLYAVSAEQYRDSCFHTLISFQPKVGIT